MLDVTQVIKAVQHNCHISDAQYAGNYSLCVFLLKMREFFRWEQGLSLSAGLPKSDVGTWMTQREDFWSQLEEASYTPLQLNQNQIDPFDSDSINAHLIPLGYVYSSGFGVFHKPHFFIGKLKYHKQTEDYTLYVAEQEHARELVAPPAMTRGNQIFIRQESLRRFIWEKIEEWQWKKKLHTPMGRVLAMIGSEDLELIMDRLVENETETLILHEVGEIEAGKSLGENWQNMIAGLKNVKAEFILRAMRDLLADTLVTLPKLIGTNQQLAIHFYFGNFSGMRKALYPQLMEAYEQWVEGGSILPLEQEVQRGSSHWLEQCQFMLAQFNNGPEEFGLAVENICRDHNIS